MNLLQLVGMCIVDCCSSQQRTGLRRGFSILELSGFCQEWPKWALKFCLSSRTISKSTFLCHYQMLDLPFQEPLIICILNGYFFLKKSAAAVWKGPAAEQRWWWRRRWGRWGWWRWGPIKAVFKDGVQVVWCFGMSQIFESPKTSREALRLSVFWKQEQAWTWRYLIWIA